MTTTTHSADSPSSTRARNESDVRGAERGTQHTKAGLTPALTSLNDDLQ